MTGSSPELLWANCVKKLTAKKHKIAIGNGGDHLYLREMVF